MHVNVVNYGIKHETLEQQNWSLVHLHFQKPSKSATTIPLCKKLNVTTANTETTIHSIRNQTYQRFSKSYESWNEHEMPILTFVLSHLGDVILV